jgi:hypothetical protein
MFFGTWNPPPILETKAPTVHVVQVHEAYRPMLIAHKVYGDRSMFWPIAVRNSIQNPLFDLTPGTVLTCPHIEDVLIALAESSDRASVS